MAYLHPLICFDLWAGAKRKGRVIALPSNSSSNPEIHAKFSGFYFGVAAALTRALGSSSQDLDRYLEITALKLVVSR
jgi:hypothetical protein